MIQRTGENEQFHVLTTIVQRAENMNYSDVKTPKDAMLQLRIEWEAVQASLYNRKNDGFEPVVDKMLTLAAAALAIAAELQARIKNEREKQLSIVNNASQDKEPLIEVPVKPEKKKRIVSQKKDAKSIV